MQSFKMRFRSIGEKLITQTIDKQNRDAFSLKLYHLYQKKHFETEALNLMMHDEVVFPGFVSPDLHHNLQWDRIRTHSFFISELNREAQPPEMHIGFEYEAISHDYVCVTILDEQTYICYRKDGKKDKELLAIKTGQTLMAYYAGKSK